MGLNPCGEENETGFIQSGPIPGAREEGVFS